MHSGSGRTLPRVVFNPPKVEGSVRDRRVIWLVVRADDERATVRKRLDVCTYPADRTARRLLRQGLEATTRYGSGDRRHPAGGSRQPAAGDHPGLGPPLP